MVTMTFNGHNLYTEYGLIVNRRATFLPPLRRRQVEIDGMDGVVELGGNTYGLRSLLVECLIHDPTALAAKVRQLAGLLTQRGKISFSDEPDLYYTGRAYESADLTRLGKWARRVDLAFECEPFLTGPTRVKTGAAAVQLGYEGTARTPCRITIKNTGSTPMQGLVLTHSIVTE